MAKRKLRMGMVGGGPGAFIGPVHRIAAQLDGEIELVCGAFSSDPHKSKLAGEALYLEERRVYPSYINMMDAEAALPADQRMDLVSIITPNHLHCDPVRRALEHGFHVVVDKPVALSLCEAESLQQTVKRTGRLLALTHPYCGYPMIKEARALVANQGLGAVRKVYVEYTQGWLSTALEKGGHKQASWRTDPSRAGSGGVVADIGTHAAHLAEYVSGLRMTAISTMLNTTIDGRQVDDDCSMLVRFTGGASGILVATQVAAGEENNLSLRLYGERGGLEWRQEEPNTLTLRWLDRPMEIRRSGWDYQSEAARCNTRIPSGHPEGYLEAFANIYRAFSRAVRDYESGADINPDSYDFPSVEAGVRGMAFIEAALESARSAHKWTTIP